MGVGRRSLAGAAPDRLFGAALMASQQIDTGVNIGGYGAEAVRAFATKREAAAGAGSLSLPVIKPFPAAWPRTSPVRACVAHRGYERA